jgi:hypothetical protein
MTATTSNKWMSPPNVAWSAEPSIHSTKRTTATAYSKFSIVSSSLRGRGRPATGTDVASVAGVMMRFQSTLLVAAALLMLAIAGCHNTAQGVKADTRRALEKTGQKLEKAGDKIEGHERKDDRNKDDR